MTRFNLWVCVMLMVAFAGYLLPWMVAPSASMTLNAFDLAEWTSLHPQQQTATIPLLVPLLLRLHLLILAVAFALVSRAFLPQSLVAAIVVLLAAAQLPPLEFVSELGNANYRQQFAFAVISLMLPLLLAHLSGIKRIPRLIMVAALLGLVMALLGQQQAETLYRHSLEDGNPGGGMFVTAAAYCAIVIATVRNTNARDLSET